MDINNQKDFLIVGFGVAGLSISKHLLDHNYSFNVIADMQPKASVVSGGLLNPVSLKRLKTAWNADLFHSFAIEFYKQFGSLLNKDYICSIPIYRLFSSIEEQNQWFSQPDANAVSFYLSNQISRLTNVYNPYQSSSVLDSFLIKLGLLIQDFSAFLQSHNSLTTSIFDYSRIQFSNDLIIYEGTAYKHLIFAEGYQMLNNPFFNYLPVYGNKGDYLIVRIPDLSEHRIYKSSKFLIPLGNQLFKFGATYQRQFSDFDISSEATRSLQSELDSLLKVDYEIVSQVSGVRPTSKDRFPVAGCHPTFKNLYILNAMGSRGIMSSPWLAKNLVESIVGGQEILKAVNVNRFTKKHFKQSNL